jgi:hypothetical protein
VIDLAFDDGERVRCALPLVADAFRVVDHGEVVTLDLVWPDSVDCAPERNRFHAINEAIALELTTETAEKDADGNPVRVPRTDVDPDRVAALATRREAASREWAAATVKGWNVKKACTRDAVLKLFDRYPFALELVMDRMGDSDRFLPDSLRPVVSGSEPVSPAVAG